MKVLKLLMISVKNGDNLITRRSDESAVTIPFEATFRDLDKSNPQTPESNLCGCGWPQHMLVPKGDKKGYPMVLFVMISNYEFDKVFHPYFPQLNVDFNALRGFRLFKITKSVLLARTQ